ncbi:MAG TPA: RNA polymerase sigma factor [Planctomycetota bacterium]|nr:RNA polymerase sigma factor [Planctomycetota bacterium]
MESEDLWTRAHNQAQNFLRRFSDAWTRSHRDDLVQEAAIAAWKWAGRSQDPRRFWAAVRTIARRIRYRALEHAQRRLDAQVAAERRSHECDDDCGYWIAGRRVPLRWVRPCLRRALQQLPALDRQLLLSFHEGFCCAELAARSRRSLECVKTRIHRARRRVQRVIEASVREADDLDES